MIDSAPPAQVDEGRLADYMDESCAFFDRASRETGINDRFFNIAGHTIRLRFAGPALESHILPALAHLAVDPIDNPAFSVLLWDKASTGVGMPAPPWSPETYVVRGEIKGISGGQIHAAISPGFHGYNLLNAAKNIAVFSVPDAACIPYYEHSSPLRTILHWWLGRHERQLVHAGVVGLPEGGVMLAGRGGSGKSVTSLTCLSAGMKYAGDDYTIIGADARPLAFSLYSSAKLNAGDISRFPQLAPAVRNPDRLDEEKAVIFIQDILPDQVVKELPVKAILLPHVRGEGPTTLKKASSALALRSLAPSTIFQLPSAGKQAFECIVQFIKSVPSYVLELGGDPEETPRVITELLK